MDAVHKLAFLLPCRLLLSCLILTLHLRLLRLNDNIQYLDEMEHMISSLLALAPSSIPWTMNSSLLECNVYLDLQIRYRNGSKNTYFSFRSQRVKIDGYLSASYNVNFGIPQSSVLGSYLFYHVYHLSGYTIQRGGRNYHVYRHNTQVYAPPTLSLEDVQL